jgi:hypothetical protein
MIDVNGFWKLEHLSDAQLLESLGGVLRAQRGALAEIVAHLGEVEDRRLHLEAAYSSMFAYCVARLGMSEDEACRRIELARLARKFPALFVELAGGRITLSVALLLKPLLTPCNHLELLVAARGKCIRQARELVAERFPRPDTPSSIRKLPERRSLANAEPSRSPSPGAPVLVDLLAPSARPYSAETVAATSLASAPFAEAQPTVSATTPEVPLLVPSLPLNTLPSAPSTISHLPPALELRALSTRSAPPRAASGAPISRGNIEPLSAGRYRIQFTADLELKQQLELARDLLRHAHPGGDFAPIIARALELLLADIQRRQFGASPGRKRQDPAPATSEALAAARSAQTSALPSSASAAERAARAPAPSARAKAPPPSASASDRAASATPTLAVSMAGQKSRPHITRVARRVVLERDGLGCSWVDAHGVRCGSRAWLQLDHREPAGKGGSSEPDNLRLLCRAHNRLAAERAYGREHMQRMSARSSRQSTDASQPQEEPRLAFPGNAPRRTDLVLGRERQTSPD